MGAAAAVGRRAHPQPPRRDDDGAPRADAVRAQHPASDPPAGGRPSGVVRSAVTGWRCTRPATPWTISACSIRWRASCSRAITCCPSITPHISGSENSADDPLALFFDSLDRVAKLDGVTIGLPAHGHPFTDFSGRGRRHQDPPRRAPREAHGGFGRHRQAGLGERADAAPVLRAGVGLDGRERDVRPSRALAPRRAGPTPIGKTAG